MITVCLKNTKNQIKPKQTNYFGKLVKAHFQVQAPHQFHTWAQVSHKSIDDTKDYPSK